MTPSSTSSPNLSFILVYPTAHLRSPPGCPTGISNTTCWKLNSSIFSLSWYLFSYSLFQLSLQLSNQSCKLGIIFDSSTDKTYR
jgi:hypothetical protein